MLSGMAREYLDTKFEQIVVVRGYLDQVGGYTGVKSVIRIRRSAQALVVFFCVPNHFAHALCVQL